MGILEDALEQGASELDLKLTEGQLNQFKHYYSLLVEVNKNLNLTSITEEKDVAVKHFIDSMTCLKAAAIDDSMTLLDIGTGAGFPGIPIKICRPGIHITLVESLEKKVNFLKEVIKRLGLGQVEAVHARAEEIGRRVEYREYFDLVLARAVAALGVLAEYCLPAVKVGGYFLAMKGPSLAEEMATAVKAIEVLGGKTEKIINLKLPLTGDERNLVLIKKVGKTPEKYPRRAGIPHKKPLR